MNKSDYLIFPVFVKQIKNFLSEKECEEIIFKLKKIELKNHETLTKDKGLSSHAININAINTLNEEFKIKLNEKINQYAHEYGFRDLNISHSWYNIEKEDCVLNFHTHPMSVVSGALYLKTDELSNKIYFKNPNPFINFSSFEKNNSMNYRYVYFNVEIGSMLLFPSWLEHGSNFEKNKSQERICLSFNTLYK